MKHHFEESAKHKSQKQSGHNAPQNARASHGNGSLKSNAGSVSQLAQRPHPPHNRPFERREETSMFRTQQDSKLNVRINLNCGCGFGTGILEEAKAHVLNTGHKMVEGQVNIAPSLSHTQRIYWRDQAIKKKVFQD